MPEGELLNHFQCHIQCVTSNSGNGNTMEIKLVQRTYPLLSSVFQKNSLCTVGKIIQFLKTTMSLEKNENHIFSIRLTSESGLSSL